MASLCNEAVKNHFEEVLRGVYPTEEAHGRLKWSRFGPKSANQSANNPLFSGNF